MTTQEAILEGNKLIAKYMGYEYYGHNDPRLIGEKIPGWKNYPGASNMQKYNRLSGRAYLCRNHKGLPYYNDWNYLMGVVWKINHTDDEYHVIIYAAVCEVIDGMANTITKTSITDEFPDIKLALWETVVNFIEYIDAEK